MDSRWALARMASHFYGNPSCGMLVVGVTGTSGKTTTTYLIESILKAAGHHVGVIGTVNMRHGEKIIPSQLTTPGSVELQRVLAQMKTEGCTAVVMEVSSHALKQHRTACIAFDGVVFTNLSPEHLDFHADMEDYFQAKALLFKEGVQFALASGKHPVAAINTDIPYGQRLLSELHASPTRGFRIADFGHAPIAQVSGQNLKSDLFGIQGKIERISIHSPLMGQFNASNILAAVAVTQGLGISDSAISAGIADLSLVPGRLERVPNTHGIHVLVDYAHKPDALENVLRTLREIQDGHRLITVFGCGGDRDRKKRPVMGRLGVEFSNHTFVTSDNPRSENPNSIIQEILQGIPLQDLQDKKNFTVEPNREKAITAALHMAQPGDLVLIAGKGHEDYQIIADPDHPGKTKKIHFDDREIAIKAMATYSEPQKSE